MGKSRFAAVSRVAAMGVVREQDSDCLAPLLGQLVQGLAKDRLLFRPRGARIHHPELLVTEEEAVRVRRGRQGRRAQRNHDQPALELDPLHHVLADRQLPGRLFRMRQQGQRLPGASARPGQRLERMPRGRMEQRRPPFPPPQCLLRLDPFAVGQLAGPDLGNFARWQVHQIEARVEADGHRRGRDPAARRGEPARVEPEPVPGKKLAERDRAFAGLRPPEQGLAHGLAFLAGYVASTRDRQDPGFLEQLAGRRDDAGRLRRPERFAAVQGHRRVLHVDTPAGKCVEAAGELQLIASPDPEDRPVFADQDHGGGRSYARHVDRLPCANLHDPLHRGRCSTSPRTRSSTAHAAAAR